MSYKNKPDGYFNNPRNEMLSFLPLDAKKILDVGCGNGTFAKAIKEINNAEIWGIELMADEAIEAKTILDKTFVGPCEDYIDDLPEGYFDAIYFNDVLEHLVDPYTVLQKIKSKLSPQGVVISSIPNIRYHSALVKLLFNKDFEYTDHGVMDKTHLRFFTKKSIYNMYTNLGYDVKKHVGINPTKSIKPFLYNIPLLFTATDIKYLQFATVAGIK
ncbi:MAG: class I SAM-dependent methyltransferase [Flavobacteriaceae bacterium]|nr:class I SAM-dependent methyltransferase [Flavobacteriaceae bacterium]